LQVRVHRSDNHEPGKIDGSHDGSATDRQGGRQNRDDQGAKAGAAARAVIHRSTRATEADPWRRQP
jgi:hypothetical protein